MTRIIHAWYRIRKVSGLIPSSVSLAPSVECCSVCSSYLLIINHRQSEAQTIPNSLHRMYRKLAKIRHNNERRSSKVQNDNKSISVGAGAGAWYNHRSPDYKTTSDFCIVFVRACVLLHKTVRNGISRLKQMYYDISILLENRSNTRWLMLRKEIHTHLLHW